MTLAPLAQQLFATAVTGTVNTSVTWAVSEGAAGGVVTANGAYTAPGSGGSYHVVVTSVADPTKSAVATVAVSGVPPPAGSAVVAGTVTTPYPTIQSISVEWGFSGDSNANAVVGVRYRALGQTAWRTGMPLRRVPARSNEGFSWTNRHSGSLFDLEQGTTYEIELSLQDPDGGSAVRTVTATTRTYPAPWPLPPSGAQRRRRSRRSCPRPSPETSSSSRRGPTAPSPSRATARPVDPSSFDRRAATPR